MKCAIVNRIVCQSPRMKFVDFHSTHVYRLQMRPAQYADMGSLDEVAARASWQSKMGPTFTAMLDSKPALVVGLMPFEWKTTAEAWMLTGRIAVEHPVMFGKAALRFLEAAHQLMGLYRVQFSAHEDDAGAVRLGQLLCNQQKYRMVGYGANGSDYWLYARVWK